MPNFGEPPTLGPRDFEGNEYCKAYCVAQKVRVQISFTQGGNSFIGCSHLWRVQATPLHTLYNEFNYPCSEEDPCGLIGCHDSTEVLSQELKGRNAVGGPPFNYTDYDNVSDWLQTLCDKKVHYDADDVFDFQIITTFLLNRCGVNTANPYEAGVCPPMLSPPGGGREFPWKIDADCRPPILGGNNDRERSRQLEEFRECFCALNEKKSSMTPEELQNCFNEIVQNYMDALFASIYGRPYWWAGSDDQFNEGDPDIFRPKDPRTKIRSFSFGCPDCAK